MKTVFTKHILQAVKLLLCCTFLYAVMIKGLSFGHFVSEMKKSPILEPYDTFVIAIGVLFFELAAAVLLSFRATEKYGLYLSFFIMLIFSAYLYILYTKYPNAPCSCGGILGSLPYPVHIGFNITLTLLSLAMIVFTQKQKKRDNISEPDPQS